MNFSSQPPTSQPAASWLKGGGEMGRRIREYDWDAHPLGALDAWPQSLKTAVSIMLNSRYAMWMGWGKEFWFFCNDAYLPTLGIKESWALGNPANKVWAEIWKDVAARAMSVVEGGESTWDEGLLLFLKRSGFAEETYHTFSYSPLPGGAGDVGGMLCVVTEETERIINDRRLTFLRQLAGPLTGVTTEDQLCDAVRQAVVLEPRDLPFVLIYLSDPSGGKTRLAFFHGPAEGDGLAPQTLPLNDAESAWFLEERPLSADSAVHIVEDLGGRFAAIPQGGWDIPPNKAVVVPILQQGGQLAAGHLVVGLNPYRAFDGAYRGFITLMAGQLSAALSNVRAYQQERQRAEQLAAIDQAKTAFFSNISHEFRTPLTLMLGPLEEIIAKEDDEMLWENRELATVAHRNGLRLLKLVNTLLDFSRLEAGRVQAAYEPLDLASVTADLANGFRRATERAGLKLIVHCPPLSEPVYVDRDLWEKIVLNLLSNAFKFTLEGEIRVELSQDEEGVKLAVHDTGCGIPVEAQAHLFERFYRVQGAHGRSHEGSGIGLALVSELVVLHGGTVTVRSTVGEGSVFIVRLPLGKDHLPLEHIRHGFSSRAKKLDASYMAEMERWQDDEPALQETVSDAELQPRPRILLADDNADMREYVARLLSPHFDVESVADGLAAQEQALQNPPDLILTDVMMPRLDGFGLLAAIRAIPETRAIPVILLSARAGEEAQVEGLDAGADDYLIKPFNARELVARVNAHLSLARMRRESATQVLQAESKVQHILALLPAGVYSCDREGKITFFNQRAVELWGRTPELNVDQEKFCACHKVFLPDGTFVSPDQAPMAVAVREGKSFHNVEAEVERPDGSRFSASINIEPFHNEKGEVIGAINVFQDVSELKVATAALQSELEERKRTADDATFLSCLSQQLSVVDNPHELLQKACEAVGTHLGVDRCYFCDLDSTLDDIAVTDDWARGDLPRLAGHYRTKDFGKEDLWNAMTRGPVAIGDSSTDPHTRDFPENFSGIGVRSFAVAPFMLSGRCLAILVVTGCEPRTWRENETRLLENVVTRVRPLVEQARAVQDLKRRNEQMELLSETLAQLLSARDPETLVRELFAKVTTHLNVDTYFNFMVNAEGDALQLHSCAGIPSEILPSIQRLEFGQAICGTVAQFRKAIVATDIQNSDYDKADLVRGFGLQSYACNPLMAGGQLLGTLSFASRTRPRFAEDELNFIRIVTHSAALMLEQLRSAASLQEKTEGLRIALSASKMGDWGWNAASDMVTMSESAGEIFGIPAGPYMTWSAMQERLHPDDRDRARLAVQHAAQTHTDYDIEYRISGDAGHFRWIAAKGRGLYDVGGALAGMRGVVQDITTRRENEEARLRLAAIVMSSDDAIISKSLDGYITSWNQGAHRMFGYTAEEVVGKSITLLIPEGRQSEEPTFLERIRNGQSIEHFETVRKRKDGSLVEVSLTISPIRDDSGKIIGVSKIGRDITERKKGELELRRREQLYRSIGESINYGIWVCDAEGRNLYSSDSFLKLVGMSQEECSDYGWALALHPDEQESTVAAWKECSRQGTFWEQEHRYKGVDGKWHPTLARGVPIRDDNGEIVRWVGINLDISTFKKTEEALRHQSRILAVLNHVSSTLVAERNLEKIVGAVTDASREISHAQVAAFFYNATGDGGESFLFHSTSDASREGFEKFPMPRNAEMLAPTFDGEGVVRLDDLTLDPRFGENSPLQGLSEGHAPVRSYLAVPIISSSGAVIGGMFFGHEEAGLFTAETEGILLGMAAQAAIAVDNASLYTSLQKELEQGKRVEAALRRSESRWRELADAMPHLVWTCAPDGAWDFVSPQWCDYTGSKEQEQHGFGWSDAIHPEDSERLEAAWNEAAHSKAPLDIEVRIRRKDGEYRWFKTRAVPIKDAVGNILKWYGSNTDIEDIKRTDVILREREAHLSAIFAQAGSGIVQTDLEGRIVMANEAYCEIVARTRDELLGLKIDELTHKEDRAQSAAVYQAMAKGESSFIVEKRDLLPDGNHVWVRNSVVGIRDSLGKVIAGLTITQDITDSREAEEALRHSEEQLRLVTDHAPVLLAQFDRRHHYKFVNRPYAERYGLQPETTIGKHVAEVVGHSAYQSALAHIELAFTGQRVEFEMAIPYDQIGMRWGHVIYVPEKSAEGEIVGVVAVLTDITMRKQVEKELELARDRALEAVRAKDDFLARLSHELRTPLSPVLLLASEGSTNRELPEAARADFETIRKNADLEARLIDDLLDITRITRGKLSLDSRTIDVHLIIRDAADTVRGEANSKKVTLNLDLQSPGHHISGDAVRIQQVLWNLLSNAVKFSASGGSIDVCTRLSDDGSAVIIETRDSGIGMTADELARVFDAFSQGDHAGKSGSQHFGGLGLGLAITRMLVELHQGRIEAKSAGRGKGSSLIVTLPLTSKEQQPVMVSDTEPMPQAVRESPERTLRILLVEDHEPTRTALSSLLRRRRHQVSIAGSLGEARKVAGNGTFDLLISDIGLPDGTGYELMEELGGRYHLKGIAVTGFGMEQDVQRSRSVGFAAHLTKPVRIEALEHAMSEACIWQKPDRADSRSDADT